MVQFAYHTTRRIISMEASLPGERRIESGQGCGPIRIHLLMVFRTSGSKKFRADMSIPPCRRKSSFNFDSSSYLTLSHTFVFSACSFRSIFRKPCPSALCPFRVGQAGTAFKVFIGWVFTTRDAKGVPSKGLDWVFMRTQPSLFLCPAALAARWWTCAGANPPIAVNRTPGLESNWMGKSNGSLTPCSSM